MISTKYNFIFQHIPKCAGQSMLKFFINLHRQEKCIDQLSLELHTPFEKVKRQQPIKYRNFFKFTFIRNPWDRVVSLYEYRRQEALKGVWHPSWPSIEELVHDSFSDNIIKSVQSNSPECLYLEPAYTDNYWLPRNILREVNFVGKFESIEKDFDYIKYVLQIDSTYTLSHSNETKRKHYSEYYNDDTRKIIADKYATDIQLFGYKFED